MTEKDLRRAYHPDYFSIDNILASQTLIQCRTEMSIPKFGFLSPFAGDLPDFCRPEDLPAGTEVKLPLWAARVLCRPGRKYVSVNIPEGFKESHRQVIDDEPIVADLKKVNSQYYEAGHLCTSLFHSDAGELAEMLPEILQQRILCIGESTIMNPRNQWALQVMGSKSIPPEFLDKLEEKIHEDSKSGTKNIKDWLEPLERPIDFPVTRAPPPPQPPPPQQQQQQQQQPQQLHRYHPTSSRAGMNQQYAAPPAASQQQQMYSYPQNYSMNVNTGIHPHPGLTPAPAHSNSNPANLNQHGNYPPQHHYNQQHHNMR